MTESHILETALKKSAIDLNCDPSCFFGSKNTVVISKKSGCKL